jgi:hypothetical protein
MMASPLGKKLQIKAGLTLHALNTPDDLKSWLSQELAPTIVDFAPVEKPAAILMFVRNRVQVEQTVFPLLKNLTDKCLVWLVYPKGTSGVETDISRDILWKLIEPLGWRPARMVALDNVWSCMRFSPITTIG